MNVWIQNPFDNLPLEGYRKQRFWLMAEAFVRAGHRVVLWTSDFNHMTKAKRLCSNGQADRIDLRLIPTRPYRRNVGLERLGSHRAYAREWERLALGLTCDVSCPLARPDLIVASTPTVSGAETAIRLGRTFGAKVVVDVMDAWPETFERLAPKGFGWAAHLVLSRLRRRAQSVYRAADFVTGVCERYRSLTGRSDYHLAYHGIELPPLSEPQTPLSNSRRPRLVYAGNLGRTYDLGTVIRGVEELGARLDVAGRGPCESEWRELVRDLGLETQVSFHGYLGERELGALLRSCDIGVVPMPTESFVGVPYKFADYVAAGLAIVSSLGGESAELLGRFRCGAGYRPNDVMGFVAAVRRVQTEGRGDVAGLRRLFNAVRIYDEYVQTVCEATAS